MSLKQTPSQTVGPYFAYGLTAEQYHYPQTQVASGQMASEQTLGERIRIVGQVFDGQGQPVNDAMIELWQANAAGRFNHPNDARQSRPLDPAFTGFGRVGTGTTPDNSFRFDTIKPGAAQDGRAPYISVIVFMRGLPNHAYTRLYFSDETVLNREDPALNRVEAARRETLIATRHETSTGVEYRFDIHMQGPLETVFFNI
ncbi:protocatechuate 3,4-dioxygenase subunit alpha [Marinobacterium rhizophilum]|uniref:Protocatechuate 3,4-dioxygenase subunit alpha n=1 Tax=Marinobacterium rhizophilum TaxID=420402 RepID=A0ABY5HCQ1_9GAMM|nr:protocatechuate 3,4-dioxygenase subunit alpha [Marinobacterium rhizophilum]UTW10125.1 protocatechuate 3,4-dioxygenase subunit alpha [Marinobacterium rhizophilum]